jgi:hypothetical protein
MLRNYSNPNPHGYIYGEKCRGNSLHLVSIGNHNIVQVDIKRYQSNYKEQQTKL